MPAQEKKKGGKKLRRCLHKSPSETLRHGLLKYHGPKKGKERSRKEKRAKSPSRLLRSALVRMKGCKKGRHSRNNKNTQKGNYPVLMPLLHLDEAHKDVLGRIVRAYEQPAMLHSRF